jgi:DNA-binding NtrC family response regulator
MQQTTVLVMAQDSFVSALLGALLELSGRRVVFPTVGETTQRTLSRAQPDLVLVDCALAAAARADVAAITQRDGPRVLMFSAAHPERDARAIANRYGAPVFVLPIKPREFSDCIDRALAVEVRE